MDEPARKGEKNDYELMDFCEGGSLDGVVLDGDEKALTEVAVRMASAIDFLAKHGILHRDIKPANFFYADKAKTQIVLADFGISVECAEGEYVKIDEMRSPVYAAPEFYTNVPGEPAEVGVESDYFSLGVSLLCLWMGKAKLTANESQLLRSKLNETLPMPKDMSEHMISLIKALTRLKMSDRATFADIRKWAQGESLDGAEAEANSDFRVVFNSAKNEVAHSPSELAHYLVSDPVLGKKYIYSGRVTRWLEETGRNEIAVNVEEIVEELHADNQEAGLWAVAYMLDPAMDYIAPDGKEFTDPAEIATHIFANHSEMADEVINPESRFMIYLTALKMDKTVDAIQDYVSSDDYDCQMDDEDLNRFVAAYYLAVLLNKEIAFPVSTGDGWEYVDSVGELLAVYKREGDLDSINKAMLSSQAFIVWLSYRRPELAGKIRMLHDKADWEDETSPYFAASSAYRIAYELDPQADFDFNTDTSDPNRIYTVEQVGLYLNDRLNRMCLGEQDEDDFTELFVEMDSHPLGDYLRARGEKYAAFLDWNRYCMDVDSADNSQKAGPYDAVIGAYKSVAGFLGSEPVYPVGDKLISSPDELKGMKNVCTMFGGEEREMPAGDDKPVAWLDAWLATFYQENPKLDLSEQFTYEKETAKYVEYIGKLCPDNYFYKRYNKAIKKVDTAAGKMRSSERSLKAKRMFFIIAGGVPTLLALVLSWFMDAPEENPIAGHVFPAFLICTICLFLSLRATAGFGGAIIPALIGGAICTGIAYGGLRMVSDGSLPRGGGDSACRRDTRCREDARKEYGRHRRQGNPWRRVRIPSARRPVLCLPSGGRGSEQCRYPAFGHAASKGRGHARRHRHGRMDVGSRGMDDIPAVVLRNSSNKRERGVDPSGGCGAPCSRQMGAGHVGSQVCLRFDPDSVQHRLCFRGQEHLRNDGDCGTGAREGQGLRAQQARHDTEVVHFLPCGRRARHQAVRRRGLQREQEGDDRLLLRPQGHHASDRVHEDASRRTEARGRKGECRDGESEGTVEAGESQEEGRGTRTGLLGL